MTGNFKFKSNLLHTIKHIAISSSLVTSQVMTARNDIISDLFTDFLSFYALFVRVVLFFKNGVVAIDFWFPRILFLIVFPRKYRSMWRRIGKTSPLPLLEMPTRKISIVMSKWLNFRSSSSQTFDPTRSTKQCTYPVGNTNAVALLRNLIQTL